MKKLKKVIEDLKVSTSKNYNELQKHIWQLICYPPKMPTRRQQDQLISEAERTTLKVKDEYFTNSELSFNTFKWGKGKNKILITHGWGSKAVDFFDLITTLRTLNDVEVVAFDAPGNGSSEGDLSNLILFVKATEEALRHYGSPTVVIGHSLGAMANIIALNETEIVPSLLVSITPLVRLKENFEATMELVGLTDSLKELFLSDFEDKFGISASYFTLDDLYKFDNDINHLVLCDRFDQIAPYQYLNDFLEKHSSIIVKFHDESEHHKILKSQALIEDIVKGVRTVCLQTNWTKKV